MKTSLTLVVPLMLAALLLPVYASAQVNSGSDGHDGALNPTANLVIDMADHPDGIYHYTSVNIPAGVTVSFIPNAGNRPVVWLVQGNCVITGVVSVNGKSSTGSLGVAGGPGGFAGGNGRLGSEAQASSGQGPGGGKATVDNGAEWAAGQASFGTVGDFHPPEQLQPASVYGSAFLIPLIGGSGGGGSGVGQGGGGARGGGAGGGGGAILIAANGEIQIIGSITANGGDGSLHGGPGIAIGGGSGGSGGAVRLVATTVSGAGLVLCSGGSGVTSYNNFSGGYNYNFAGQGRVRIDAMSASFGGGVLGVITRGFQPIVILPENQAVSLSIQSVGGVAVAANPAGQLTTPDVIVPASQQNPVPIVVRCRNIPLNTEIIVDVKPANGATVRAVALNNVGTQASSTATVPVNMPRGGGTIQAKAVSGITLAAADGVSDKVRSLAETGWTTDGERFAQVEVTATLGGAPQIAYLTESGKRYALQTR